MVVSTGTGSRPRGGCWPPKSIDPLTALVEDVRVPDVPLAGTVQSKTWVPDGTSWTVERDLLADDPERLAHAVAGDAPADREQARRQLVQAGPRSRQNLPSRRSSWARR